MSIRFFPNALRFMKMIQTELLEKEYPHSISSLFRNCDLPICHLQKMDVKGRTISPLDMIDPIMRTKDQDGLPGIAFNLTDRSKHLFGTLTISQSYRNTRDCWATKVNGNLSRDLNTETGIDYQLIESLLRNQHPHLMLA